MAYTISKQLTVTVPVSRKVDGVLVDPATFLFSLQPPIDGGFAYPLSTYAWNGSAWTNSESVIAVPSRLSQGTFRLTITVPHLNVAKGVWALDWYHTANNSGDGQGGDNATFVITPSPALP